MKNVIGSLGLMIVLIGCNASTDVTTAARTTGGSFSSTTSKSVLLIKQFPSAVVDVTDLVNGVASLKDTNSEPSKWVISFDISDLSNAVASDVYLSVYYDGKAPAVNHVSSLGSLRLYKGAGNANPGAAYWNNALTEVATVLSSDATLNGLSNKTGFRVDVTDAINASIAAQDSVATFVMKWDTEVNGTNHNVNFYCSYTSSILAAYIPTLSGNF